MELKSKWSGRTSGLAMGRNMEAQDQNQKIQAAREERDATKFKQAQDEDQAFSAEKEGLPALIFGAFTGKDPAKNVSEFNSNGPSQISGYSFDDDDGSFVMKAADGAKEVRLRPEIVSGFMEKYYGIKIPLEKTSRGIGSGTNFAIGEEMNRWAGKYDLEELDSTKMQALKDGMASGISMDEMAPRLGIGLTPKYKRSTQELEKLNSDIEMHRQKIERGDSRHWFRNRQKTLEDLLEQREEIMQGLGMTAESQPTEEAPEAAQGQPQRRTEGLGGGGHVSMPEKLNKTYDANGNGKIEYEEQKALDRDYAAAKRVVELANDPETTDKITKQLGVQKITAAVALVTAVEKNAKKLAEQRVQGLRGS